MIATTTAKLPPLAHKFLADIHRLFPRRRRQWLPSGWVKRECGRALWERSVVADFDLPAMGPCESCAHVVFLPGKTRRGWITWGEG